VCPAARRDVEALDLDEPQHALAPRLLAKRQLRGFVRVGEPNRDGTILPDDAVGLAFGARCLAGRHFTRQVDR
jgi:hypothetical protein